MFPKISKDKIRDYEKSMFAQTFTNFRVIITFISLKRFGPVNVSYKNLYYSALCALNDIFFCESLLTLAI